MQGENPLIPPDGTIPATNGFQLQLGPEGRCRLVLLGRDDAPLAVLDLDAAQADRLAQELANRRQTYAKGHRRDPAH